MNQPLPALASLRAFEAAARHVSVKRAAEELNVTPGAVSLQVRELEASLGVQLFVREPRQLRLTPPGEDYFASLRTAFRLMREATVAVMAQARLTVVSISCTPSFATQWLVPRLGRFEAEHADLDVRISASNRLTDFGRDGVDIAIRHGFGRYDGLTSERLVDDHLVPVCSPILAPTLKVAADLGHVALLHDEHRHDWRLWLEAAGAPGVDSSRGTVFTDCNGAIEAAKAGHGVALARRSLVERELVDGSLIAPFPAGLASDLAYHLVYPAAALDRPAIAIIRAWLRTEADHQGDWNQR